MQQNIDPQFEKKMPSVFLDERQKASLRKKRSQTEYENSSGQFNFQKFRVNSLTKNRSASSQDLCTFEFLSYKRKMNDLKLAKEIAEVRQIQEICFHKKNRMNEERLKLDKVDINSKRPSRNKSNQKSSIEIEMKRSERIESIDGLRLSNVPILSIPNKNKENKPAKTTFKWKIGNNAEKKTKKLIIL